jgi:hypothetical protein
MPSEDLQLSFGGLTCGKSTPYRIRTIEGLDDFAARGADDTIAGRWGSLVGSDMVESPRIVVEFIFPNDPSTILDLEAAFRPAPQSAPSSLLPLMWKWPGKEERIRWARCRRRTRPMTVQSERTNGPVSMFVELYAPDPRAYSADLHSEAAPPFTADSLYLDFTDGTGGDLSFDFTDGSGGDLSFDFAGTAASGTIIVRNSGTVASYPRVTFAAPLGMERWSLTNLTTGDEATFIYPLGSGQQMVVDFAVVATPATGDAVLVNGTARYSAWRHPRVPLTVEPGDNEFRFDVLDGDTTNALALIEWRHAYV